MKNIGSLVVIYYSVAAFSLIIFVALLGFMNDVSFLYPPYHLPSWLLSQYALVFAVFIELSVLISALIYVHYRSPLYGKDNAIKYSMLFISSFAFFLAVIVLTGFVASGIFLRYPLNLSGVFGYIGIASILAIFIVPLTYLIRLYGKNVRWNSLVFVLTESFVLGQYLILSSGTYQDFPWYKHWHMPCRVCLVIIGSGPPLIYLIAFQYVFETLIFLGIILYVASVYKKMIKA